VVKNSLPLFGFRDGIADVPELMNNLLASWLLVIDRRRASLQRQAISAYSGAGGGGGG
jgi:hypothetical protein